MVSAGKYWKFVRLDATGKRQIEEITAAKSFLQAQLGEALWQTDLTDAALQRQIWQIWQSDSTTAENRRWAEVCLRCYISNQIEQVCVQLEAQFGSEHGFTRYDLFPLVLNDVLERRPHTTAVRTAYRSLASEILQSFNPFKASLSTWVTRLVRHDKEVNAFLLDHGIYLISDWAILNDTTPKQVQRILSEFHALTITEIRSATQLLEGYHQIYRQDRLQQRQSGFKGQCPAPTLDQLRRIAQALEAVTPSRLTPEATLSRLQTLATQLRQYRIYARGGAAPTESLDQPEQQTLAVEFQSPERDLEQEEENEFLRFYRHQFLSSLDLTLASVTSDRLEQLRRKGLEGMQQFLSAMHLFHCQGRSMTEIATEVGLQAQYQVTRLLKLKEFRAEVRQRLLLTLRDRILDKAKDYADPNQLKALDQTLDAALDEQIAAILQQAETEASVAKHCPLDSLFARRLCHHLDHRSVES